VAAGLDLLELMDGFYILTDDQQELIEDFSALVEIVGGSTIDNNWSLIGADQKNVIQMISEKESFVGSMARSILCFHFEECIDDPVIFPNPANNRYVLDESSNKDHSNVSLSPIPANERITLEWEMAYSNCTFEVTGTQGSLIFQTLLEVRSGIESFNTSSWIPRLYVWSIQKEGLLIESGSFAVIR
jgi:hypothetical protein